MSSLVSSSVSIPALSDQAVQCIAELEKIMRSLKQHPLETFHIVHGGMYARTITLPRGARLVGTLLKVPTMLVVVGDVEMYIGTDEPLYLNGYNVLPASKNRKQLLLAQSDLVMTMFFATNAKTVAEIEEQLTDEAANLQSRRSDQFNHITITGE